MILQKIKHIWLFFTISSFFNIASIQHPTGTTTVYECVRNNASVVYLLEEENGTKQFVLTLENCLFIGQGGIVTSNGKILTDTETYREDQQELLKNGRDISKEYTSAFDETVAIISSPGQQCYYHWLLQVIPRLKILSDSKLTYDKIYIYADNFKYSWQKDSLFKMMDYLSIPHEKLLFIKKDIIVQAKKGLIPSVPWIPSKSFFWKAELAWYKKLFKDVFIDENKKTPSRIFISRSKAQYRRIKNEVALMHLLQEKGFISYCLEDLTIAEQAALFNNAKVIVGPHGAGWANLIFCNPKTLIIEIDHGIQGEEQRSAFKGMAKRMHCSYHAFYTDIIDPTNCPEKIDHPINQDMTVDIIAFDHFLQKLNL